MTRAIVDTSVWRAFFAGRAAARELRALLDEAETTVVHPRVLGELVLGGLSKPQENLLLRLPQAQRLPHADVTTMIRRCRLLQRGIGWVDAELLASAFEQRICLWSPHNSLAAVPAELGVALNPQAFDG